MAPDKEVCPRHVPRRQKVGERNRWIRTVVSTRPVCSCTYMLQDLGAGEALGSGVKALQSYDTVRKQVIDVDEKGRGHYDRIAKAIQ